MPGNNFARAKFFAFIYDIKNIEINDGDAKLRANFDRAFNSNFLDGDEKSNPSEEEMYKFAVDNKGEVINDGEKVKSLVSDQTRVVKGGSWKDRSYWLDPSQRRLMPEFMSADYIGFRCAMSYLGAVSYTHLTLPTKRIV